MSKFFSLPVFGIDVSADFSMVAILAPNGDIKRKPFRINHDVQGFNYLIGQIKKVEEEYSMKSQLFMESTGIYHLTLFHFLKSSNLEAYVINPLITNCNKNSSIRKVKNDKFDALSIARIAKYQNIKMSDVFDIASFAIKSLCRDYYGLVDSRSNYKKKLSSDLRIFYPGYHTVFSDTTGNTSLAFLAAYTSPKAVLEAPKEAVMLLLKQHAKRGIDWCTNTYNKLMKTADNAIQIGIDSGVFASATEINLSIIKTFNEQIDKVISLIQIQIDSDETHKIFKEYLALLIVMPGVGFITAVTILSEIGDPLRFGKPKQLVAFFGIDPSVNESGKFKGDKNKMSKRGSNFARRALYAIALASVRKSGTGKPVNCVLYQYRKENLQGKKNKVALVAIMHKIVNYIFAVLRDKKPYVERNPQLHSKMFLNNATRKTA